VPTTKHCCRRSSRGNIYNSPLHRRRGVHRPEASKDRLGWLQCTVLNNGASGQIDQNATRTRTLPFPSPAVRRPSALGRRVLEKFRKRYYTVTTEAEAWTTSVGRSAAVDNLYSPRNMVAKTRRKKHRNTYYTIFATDNSYGPFKRKLKKKHSSLEVRQ